MWQSVLELLREWMSRPYWVAGIGFAGGFMLFLTGLIWKKPRDCALGFAAMVLGLSGGILLYLIG